MPENPENNPIEGVSLFDTEFIIVLREDPTPYSCSLGADPVLYWADEESAVQEVVESHRAAWEALADK